MNKFIFVSLIFVVFLGNAAAMEGSPPGRRRPPLPVVHDIPPSVPVAPRVDPPVALPQQVAEATMAAGTAPPRRARLLFRGDLEREEALRRRPPGAMVDAPPPAGSQGSPAESVAAGHPPRPTAPVLRPLARPVPMQDSRPGDPPAAVPGRPQVPQEVDVRRPAPPPDPVRRPSPPIRAERRAPPPAGEPQGRDFYIRDASDISRVLTQWGQDHDKDLAIITELARALWGSRVSWEEFTDLIIEIGPRLPATSHNRIAQEGYHILASVQIKLGKTVTSSLEQDSALQIAVFMHSLTGQDISIQHMNKLKALYAHSTLTIMTWIQGIVSQAISLCQPFQATAEARVQRLEQYLEVLLNRKIKYEIEKLFTEQRGFDRLIPESVLNKTRQLTDLSFYTRGLHYKHLAHLGFIQITTPDLFPIRGAQILEALGRKGVRTQVALPALAQQLRTCEEIYIASVGRANMGLSPPEPAIALRIPPPDQEQIRVINQELEHLSQVPRLMEAIFSTDFERGGPTPAEAHMLSDLSQRHNVAFNIAVAKCWLGQLTTDWLKQSRKFVGVTPEDVWSWDLSKSHPRLAKEILHLPPQTE